MTKNVDLASGPEICKRCGTSGNILQIRQDRVCEYVLPILAVHILICL